MTFRKKQLSDESRKILAKNLIDRITAAHDNMKSILAQKKVKHPNDLPDKAKEAYQYNFRRSQELDISYRLIHNTNWLMDIRSEVLQNVETLLADESKLHPAQVTNYKRMKAVFDKQLRCSKCNQTGIVGEKISTGEYKLCSCVSNHLDIYKNL